MDDKYIRLEDKLDRVLEVQGDIRADLQEHMRRTEIAEEGINKLAAALQPIQKHVAVVQGSGQLLAWVLGIVAAIATTYVAFRYK